MHNGPDLALMSFHGVSSMVSPSVPHPSLLPSTVVTLNQVDVSSGGEDLFEVPIRGMLIHSVNSAGQLDAGKLTSY